MTRNAGQEVIDVLRIWCMGWGQEPDDSTAEVGSVRTQKLFYRDLCVDGDVLIIGGNREYESTEMDEIFLLQLVDRTICLELNHIKHGAPAQTDTILFGQDDLASLKTSDCQVRSVDRLDS